MWGYSQGGMLLQWAFGGLVVILVLSRIWPLNESFGIYMPAATVGIICSIVLCLIFLRIGTRRGYSSCLTQAETLPEELRIGLVAKDKRRSIGEEVFSSISVSTLTFHLSLVALIVLFGYLLGRGGAKLAPGLELPVFSCAYLAGMTIKALWRYTNIKDYICPQTMSSLSGMFTDYLVAFGIASIKISIVGQYIVPLTILFVSGLIFTALYIFLAAKHIFKEYWFEKAMFSWGWFTGTMAMGMALLRIADPESRSKCMDHYAIAYILIAPIEIALITFAPIIFCNGYGLWFSLACLLIGLSIVTYMLIDRRKSRN